MLRRICVFCGSSPGASAVYLNSAKALGKILAARKIGLVYGGASVGLMGVVADAVLAGGGEVIGVIPQNLQDKEITHEELSELHFVDSMSQRKTMMSGLADGFIALPGGLGTLDELFEVLAEAQLDLHLKPCGVLNVKGFFDPIRHLLEHAIAERFIHPDHGRLLILDDQPEKLLDKMINYQPLRVEKWLDRIIPTN